MSTFDYLKPAEAVTAARSDAPDYQRITGLQGVSADRIPNLIPEEPWRAHGHLDKFKEIARVEWAKDADPGTAEVFYADDSTDLLRSDDLLCIERPITSADRIRPAVKAQGENGNRRMAEVTAREISDKITGALADLNTWQEQHPNVADYRVTEALQRLSRAETLLNLLVTDTDPEGDAARAQLKASGFFDGE